MCFKPDGESLHLHWIVIFPEWRVKGFGEAVMALIERLAVDASKQSVSLSCFKSNDRARAFYGRLGYVESEDDAHFVRLSKGVSG